MTAPRRPVALVTSSMEGGGAQRAVAKLASGFARRGLPVDLVLAHARGPFLQELHPEVRVVDLAARRAALAVAPLARYLRSEAPATVFAALDYMNVVTVAARALAGSDARLVVSERNNLSAAVTNARRLRTRLMPWFIRLAYPRADGVVAVSAGVADDLARTCRLERSTITVLNNPVVTAASVQMRREPVDHPWLTHHERPVVLAVGRLMPQKNHQLLVRAFARLRQSTDARLLILGEGPLRGELERLAHELGLDEHVSLPGFCPNPYPAMAAADVFVLPSAWEGSPGVLIEAMATGTPVVATDCPSGPREILDHGRHGRLVGRDDEDALARALEDALCGRVAPPPEESWRPYDEDRVVDTYLEVLLPGRQP